MIAPQPSAHSGRSPCLPLPPPLKIERLFARLGAYRRLVTRWEFHVHNFLCMVQLACAMLLLRHL